MTMDEETHERRASAKCGQKHLKAILNPLYIKTLMTIVFMIRKRTSLLDREEKNFLVPKHETVLLQIMKRKPMR